VEQRIFRAHQLAGAGPSYTARASPRSLVSKSGPLYWRLICYHWLPYDLCHESRLLCLWQFSTVKDCSTSAIPPFPCDGRQSTNHCHLSCIGSFWATIICAQSLHIRILSYSVMLDQQYWYQCSQGDSTATSKQ
jgi:hypothetical protein